MFYGSMKFERGNDSFILTEVEVSNLNSSEKSVFYVKKCFTNLQVIIAAELPFSRDGDWYCIEIAWEAIVDCTI